MLEDEEIDKGMEYEFDDIGVLGKIFIVFLIIGVGIVDSIIGGIKKCIKFVKDV